MGWVHVKTEALTNQKAPIQERNAGVDLLRVLSMFMVVVLHVLGQGGVLAAMAPQSPGYFLGWTMEAACFCAVNCFGMISGYAARGEAWKPRKYFVLWAQAAVYSAGISLLFKLFLPTSVSLRGLLGSFFPVVTQKYWYFTAYFGLMFLSPFLNTLLFALTPARARQLALAILALFCLLPTAVDRDIFYLRGGYTLLWLCALYLLGGCLRRLELRRGGTALCLAGYLLCVCLTAGSKALLEAAGCPVLRSLWRPDVLFSYTSPTILAAAVCLLLLFRDLPLQGKAVRQAAAFLSPLSFGVYLIHTHPLMWNFFLAGRFRPFAAFPLPVCAALILLAAGGIFTACIGVDFIRERLFRLLLPARRTGFRSGLE